jgi:hypothetical protein
MSTGTSRFILDGDNLALASAGAVVCNNDHTTYPSAPDPPLNEDPAFPLANVLTSSRRAVALIPAGQSGDFYVVLDLGQARSIGVVGLAGASLVPGATYPQAFQAYYATGSSYPSSWTSFTVSAVTWAGERNLLAVLAAAVDDVRWVRFKFPSANLSTGFTVGKFVLAEAATEVVETGKTPILYSPDAAFAPLSARARVNGMDGQPFVSIYGPTRTSGVLPFNSVTGPTMENLRALADESRPFLFYFAHESLWHECIADPASFAYRHQWATGADVWNVSIGLETLY